MADGYIEFSTKLDNADLEKKLKSAEKSVDKLKQKLEGDTEKRTLIEKAMDRNEQAIHEAEAEIERFRARIAELESGQMDSPQAFMQAKSEIEQINARLVEQEKALAKQIAEQDKLNGKWQAANDVVEATTQKLERAQAAEAELGAQAQAAAAKTTPAWERAGNAIKAKFASVAQSARQSLANAASSAAPPWENFGKRVNTMLKKVFVFGMVLKGIRAIKSRLSEMLNENEQFRTGVENLKAVMDGFLASMVQAVLPVIVSVVNTLSGIFERLAGIIDQFFGTNIVGNINAQRQAASDAIAAENAQKRAEYEAEVAKAEQKQAKAASKLAKAQEKANRQLLAFDEINALSADAAEDATDALDDYTDAIEAPDYATDWTQSIDTSGGLFQGVLDWLDMIRQRIATDIEGPFARIREGLGLIRQGIGQIVEGIMSGDWAMAWEGFGNVVIGALYVVEGAFGALMDYLNDITGHQFADVFDGLKLMAHGFVEFIEGLLRGDLQLVLQGLHDFVDGLGQTVTGIFDAVLNGVMWLIDNIAGLSSAKWNELFDILEARFPQFKGALEVLRGFVLGVGDVLYGALKGLIDGAGALVHSFVDGAVQLFGGLFDFLAGLFTGNTDLMASGFRAMINGLITMVEGALNAILTGAAGFLNGIISAVNRIPGVNFQTYTPSYAQLPRLATGAVIPPNREFLAVLGDQRRGTNIEAPADLIRQIVREESGGGANMQSAVTAGMVAAMMQLMPTLRDNIGGDVLAELKVDGDVLARQLNARNDSLARRGLISEYGY